MSLLKNRRFVIALALAPLLGSLHACSFSVKEAVVAGAYDFVTASVTELLTTISPLDDVTSVLTEDTSTEGE